MGIQQRNMNSYLFIMGIKYMKEQQQNMEKKLFKQTLELWDDENKNFYFNRLKSEIESKEIYIEDNTKLLDSQMLIRLLNITLLDKDKNWLTIQNEKYRYEYL